MTDKSAFSALISIPKAGVAVLGRSVPERQLDFALAAGVDRVLLIGDGGGGAAIALRHQAEKAGARVVVLAGAHALAAMAREGGRLMVLQPGLVPASQKALDLLSRGESVLILPAGSGNEAGFERIDLARCWGGALAIDEERPGRLLDLPGDIEASPALLRIALQAGVEENQLDEHELAVGNWALVTNEAKAGQLEENWLRRSEARHGRLAGRLGNFLAMRWLRRWPVRPIHAAALAIVALAGAVLAIFTAWRGLAAGSLGLTALAALAFETALSLQNWRRFPLGKPIHLPAGVLALDLTMAVCGFFAIEGGWHVRLFAPMVLAIALQLPQGALPRLDPVLRDRMAIGLLLGLAALAGIAEQAIMALALLLLACGLPVFRRPGG